MKEGKIQTYIAGQIDRSPTVNLIAAGIESMLKLRRKFDPKYKRQKRLQEIFGEVGELLKNNLENRHIYMIDIISKNINECFDPSLVVIKDRLLLEVSMIKIDPNINELNVSQKLQYVSAKIIETLSSYNFSRAVSQVITNGTSIKLVNSIGIKKEIPLPIQENMSITTSEQLISILIDSLEKSNEPTILIIKERLIQELINLPNSEGFDKLNNGEKLTTLMRLIPLVYKKYNMEISFKK